MRVGRRLRSGLPLAGLALVVLALAACASAHRAPAGPKLTAANLWRVLATRCTALDARPDPYPWPLKPFNRQHPIRGYFGDPRTVIYGQKQGIFSFHNGVDILAWNGNEVYAVASGRVLAIKGDEVITSASHGRKFQYIHLHPRVKVGDPVVVSQTLLGLTFEPWEHVHLSELRGRCVVNPLAPGHLTPYADPTHPRVLGISFTTPAGGRLAAGDLYGEVRAVARAQAPPADPAPGVWRRMPVSPALVTWQLTAADGRRVGGGIAADFLVTEPPPAAFCDVYAPGTLQNFAAESGHYNWGRPGRYLYQLGPPLNTATLANGRYLYTVTAANARGGIGHRSVTIEIANHGQDKPASAAPPDWRCQRRARGGSSLLTRLLGG